jgi:hypothetical protein
MTFHTNTREEIRWPGLSASASGSAGGTNEGVASERGEGGGGGGGDEGETGPVEGGEQQDVEKFDQV